MRALTLANAYSLVNGGAVGPHAVTATSASPAVFTWTAHGALNGDIVVLGGSAVPTGFVAGTQYFVVAKAANTFELSATSGGAAINSSSTGTAVTATYYPATGDTSASAAVDLMDSDSVTTDPYIQEFAAGGVTATSASPGVFTWPTTGFGFADGDLAVVADGTVPTGIVLGTGYYIINSNSGAGTFELAATRGGSPINTTGAGSDMLVFVTSNTGGDGVTNSPGAPFLPDYSGVLAVYLSSDIANATFYVEGADALADGTNSGVYSYALNGASGQTAAGVSYFFIAKWPQFIRVRNVIAGTVGLGVGTAQVSALGTG